MDRTKLRNAAFLAGAVFLFGIVTAIYEYYRDNNSMDFEAIAHARGGAILHAVLWTIVAGVVFAVQLIRK
ncbi:MAG TPA: hypothetical protein VGR70_17085 [Stellaceae bacterium]|nr:hypothetical protein [Stellaceae bacterium]